MENESIYPIFTVSFVIYKFMLFPLGKGFYLFVEIDTWKCSYCQHQTWLCMLMWLNNFTLLHCRFEGENEMFKE